MNKERILDIYLGIYHNSHGHDKQSAATLTLAIVIAEIFGENTPKKKD